MFAAASGHGNIGIPETVAKEFISHSDSASGRAAGIMFLTPQGETLLLRRGNGGDFPNMYGLPGGHLENGENLEDAARREALEETGYRYEGKLRLLHDDGQFATFLAEAVEKFPVTICEESTGFDWTIPSNAPQPLHPGLSIAFRIASAGTETDIAKLMAEDILPSPQKYANMHLLALRITGTGMAYRSKLQEHVWRDSAMYLNSQFLERCNGLTVVMDHPDSAMLDSKEFKDRAIGAVLYPYIKGDEVWGIAKIYDDEAMAQIIQEGDSPEGISTSPSVVFDDMSGNTTLTTNGGEPLLIEGIPFLLDHIAIVTKAHGSKGVWDKGGDATGVSLTNQEVSMTDKLDPKADASGTPAPDATANALAAIMTTLTGITARMDSMEKTMPAPSLVSAADKSKADADEAEDKEKKAKADADEKEAAEKKADADGKEEGKSGDIKPDADEEVDEKARKADAEDGKFADAQAKADSVLAAFGKSASRPLQGENLMSYRKRLLRGLQAFSDDYKGVDLKVINDDALLSLAERKVYADAAAHARAPGIAGDGLIETQERDRAGRTISKFRGSMESWLGAFKVPAQSGSFVTANSKR